MSTDVLPPVSVTPLAGNDLGFRSLSGSETMNGLFDFTVEVLSTNGTIKLAEVLGEKMTVSVPLGAGGVRFFNGYVTRFSRVGTSGRSFLYRAFLHPWLWFLSRTADCRIFQNQSIPDIVKAVFAKYPNSLLQATLEDYPPQPYLVQYRETDLVFVNRLLERAGIAYHFTHANGSHAMVLTDSISGRAAVDGYETIPLRAETEAGAGECLTSWDVSQEVASAGYVLKDFDYLKPKAPLIAALSPLPGPAMAVVGELFDYPGQYLTNDDGSKAAALRLEQAQTFYETIDASGPVRGVGVGSVFSLGGPLSAEGDRRFLVVKAHYEVHGHSAQSTDALEDDRTFHCALTVIDAGHPFRPACRTPVPVVQGPQTAIVIGRDKHDASDGKDEICTDELGRILVRFPWERPMEAKPSDSGGIGSDEDKPICWLRVAQLWAGAGWGTVFIPRIGQEVMVEFLEGDPDRPIVTGRVYNQSNRPAYLDESKATQSGIRTHSTPGGGPKNFNEIRFEDKKGSEELYVQAEKNHTVHVKADRKLTVGGDETITVKGSRTTTVTKLVSETFNKGHMLNVYAADQHLEIGESKIETVGKNYDLTTMLKYSLTQGETNLTCEGGNVHLKAAGTVLIEAPTEITLKVGGNSITLSASGIKITGGGSQLSVSDQAIEATAPDINLNG